MNKRKYFFASFVAFLSVAGMSVGLAVAGTRAPDREASAGSARSAADPCAAYPTLKLYSTEDPGYAYPTWFSTDSSNFSPAFAVTPYPGWANPIGPSTWVSWNANKTSGKSFPSTYYYRVTRLMLPPKDPSRVFTLTGQVLADNQTDIEIGGTTVAGQPGGSSPPSSNFAGPPYSFTISGLGGNPSNGFIDIDFKVTDTSGPATGVDFSMTLSCSPALPDLTIQKTCNPPTPPPWQVGDTHTCTTVVTNLGPGTVPAGSSIYSSENPLPAGLTEVSTNPAGGCPQNIKGTGSLGVVCQTVLGAPLPPSGTVTIVWTLHVDSLPPDGSGKFTNCVVTAGTTPSGAPLAEANTTNNNACVDIQVIQPLPDLQMTKTCDPSPWIVGGTYMCTTTITNVGDADIPAAAGINWFDAFGPAAGITEVSTTSGFGCVQGVKSPGNVGCQTSGPLAKGSSVSITWKFHVDSLPAGGTFTNCATAAGQTKRGGSFDLQEKTMSNNKSCVDITVANPPPALIAGPWGTDCRKWYIPCRPWDGSLLASGAKEAGWSIDPMSVASLKAPDTVVEAAPAPALGKETPAQLAAQRSPIAVVAFASRPGTSLPNGFYAVDLASSHDGFRLEFRDAGNRLWDTVPATVSPEAGTTTSLSLSIVYGRPPKEPWPCPEWERPPCDYWGGPLGLSLKWPGGRVQVAIPTALNVIGYHNMFLAYLAKEGLLRRDGTPMTIATYNRMASLAMRFATAYGAKAADVAGLPEKVLRQLTAAGALEKNQLVFGPRQEQTMLEQLVKRGTLSKNMATAMTAFQSKLEPVGENTAAYEFLAKTFLDGAYWSSQSDRTLAPLVGEFALNSATIWTKTYPSSPAARKKLPRWILDDLQGAGAGLPYGVWGAVFGAALFSTVSALSQ